MRLNVSDGASPPDMIQENAEAADRIPRVLKASEGTVSWQACVCKHLAGAETTNPHIRTGRNKRVLGNPISETASTIFKDNARVQPAWFKKSNSHSRRDKTSKSKTASFARNRARTSLRLWCGVCGEDLT